jgi:hypothetical protein
MAVTGKHAESGDRDEQPDRRKLPGPGGDTVGN